MGKQRSRIRWDCKSAEKDERRNSENNAVSDYAVLRCYKRRFIKINIQINHYGSISVLPTKWMDGQQNHEFMRTRIEWMSSCPLIRWARCWWEYGIIRTKHHPFTRIWTTMKLISEDADGFKENWFMIGCDIISSVIKQVLGFKNDIEPFNLTVWINVLNKNLK